MTDKVKFIRCNKDQYEKLSTKDDNALYFCTDTQEIFVGNKLYAEGQGKDLFVTKDGEPNSGTVSLTGNLSLSGDGTINATNGKVIVTKPTANDESANKLYVDEAVATAIGTVANAMIFKGTVTTNDQGVGVLPTEYKVGYSYKVITAGTYAGQKCEIGDMLVAVAVSNPIADSDWIVIQSNIDGAVTADFKNNSDVGKLPKIAAGNSLEPTDIDPDNLATKSRVDEVETGYQNADTALKTELEGKITDAATVWETLA